MAKNRRVSPKSDDRALPDAGTLLQCIALQMGITDVHGHLMPVWERRMNPERGGEPYTASSVLPREPQPEADLTADEEVRRLEQELALQESRGSEVHQ